MPVVLRDEIRDLERELGNQSQQAFHRSWKVKQGQFVGIGSTAAPGGRVQIIHRSFTLHLRKNSPIVRCKKRSVFNHEILNLLHRRALRRKPLLYKPT